MRPRTRANFYRALSFSLPRLSEGEALVEAAKHAGVSARWKSLDALLGDQGFPTAAERAVLRAGRGKEQLVDALKQAADMAEIEPEVVRSLRWRYLPVVLIVLCTGVLSVFIISFFVDLNEVFMDVFGGAYSFVYLKSLQLLAALMCVSALGFLAFVELTRPQKRLHFLRRLKGMEKLPRTGQAVWYLTLFGRQVDAGIPQESAMQNAVEVSGFDPAATAQLQVDPVLRRALKAGDPEGFAEAETLLRNRLASSESGFHPIYMAITVSIILTFWAALGALLPLIKLVTNLQA